MTPEAVIMSHISLAFCPWQAFPVIIKNTLAYWGHIQVTEKIKSLIPKPLIFFVTNEWVQ